MGTLEDKVDLGIKFLNKHIPSWLNKVDLSILDIHHPNKCILAQAHTGSFSEAVTYFQIAGMTKSFGFAADTKIEEDQLTEIWKKKITNMLDKSEFETKTQNLVNKIKEEIVYMTLSGETNVLEKITTKYGTFGVELVKDGM